MTRRSDRGYALFLAAVVVAILSFVLLAVARVQGGLAPSLRLLAAQTDEEIAAETLTARLAFLLLTEPVGPGSIVIGGPRDPGVASGEQSAGARGRSTRAPQLRLDGRRYIAGFVGGARVEVSVQDEAGLLNLNAPDEAAMAALLEQTGVRSPRSEAMAASLADFTDGDDLTRANGAEGVAYARLGLPPPPNAPLSSRWQALNVMGWRDGLNGAQRDALWRLVTAGEQQQGINLNTAPLAVIAAVTGDARTAQALVERREAGELRDLQEVEGLTGARDRAAGAAFALRPGTNFRIVIAFGEGADRGVERRLVLAGPEAERPAYWRDERRGVIGAENRQDREQQPEPLPYSASMPAS